MSDPTENIRRAMVAEINAEAAPRTMDEHRAAVEAEHGQCWNTDELQRDFSVQGFAAPFVIVRRKSDGVEGSLMFSHSPRLYYNFQPR